jgi:hypothetical protein
MTTDKQPWPVPLWPLWRNHSYRALPSAGVGIVLRLVEHYWLTGCRPFNRDDPTILALSRGHKATYLAHREDILNAVEAWVPVAEAYWRKREGNRRGQVNGAHSANSTRRFNAISKHHTAPETISKPKKERPQSWIGPTPGPSTSRYFTD